MKRFMGFAAVVVLALPIVAQADDLYNTMNMVDDVTYDSGNGNAISGQGAFGQIYDLQMADDFDVPSGGFIIQELEQASVTFFGQAPLDIAIRIYPDAGGVPSETAAYEALAVADLGLSVDASGFSDGVFGLAGVRMGVSGLNIALAAGTYWLNLQPIDESNAGDWYFQVRDLDLAINGDAHMRDGESGYPGGYGVSDWTSANALGFGAGEGAMRISGVVPEPASLSLLAMAGLALLRRRN